MEMMISGLPLAGPSNCLHYFLHFSQLLVSCLPLLDKLISLGVSDLSRHNNNNQAHLNLSSLSNNGRQETRSWLKFR